MKGYWVKGRPYHLNDYVIHHFDTLEEAKFYITQVADGKILDWGEGRKLSEKEREGL